MERMTTGVLAVLTVLGMCMGSSWAGTIQGKVTCQGTRDNADAVVYVEQVDGTFAPPTKPVTIDQQKMKFTPHVQPVVVGTTVDFLNSDPVLHNVFTPSRAGDRFNLGSWPQGEVRSYTFKQAGEVRLLCNVHPEMLAWVIVLQNPFFAKTGPDGTFAIGDVPAGSYVLKVWHERLKPATENVTVPASGSVDVDLTISR